MLEDYYKGDEFCTWTKYVSDDCRDKYLTWEQDRDTSQYVYNVSEELIDNYLIDAGIY